ncbi:MAG: hypothetical protein VYC55_07940 [Pseudomonadota bacterium]|nr:hypothetical protein [Pseudomonadota bacterium]
MILTSSLSNATIAQHAQNALNVESEFDIEVRSESFGVAVTVTKGPSKGFYDCWKEGGQFKFLMDA